MTRKECLIDLCSGFISRWSSGWTIWLLSQLLLWGQNLLSLNLSTVVRQRRTCRRGNGKQQRRIILCFGGKGDWNSDNNWQSSCSSRLQHIVLKPQMEHSIEASTERLLIHFRWGEMHCGCVALLFLCCVWQKLRNISYKIGHGRQLWRLFTL